MGERTCAAEDCQRSDVTGEWCHLHYTRLRRNGSLEPLRAGGRRGGRKVGPCKVERCAGLSGTPGAGHGYCGKHYQRWKKHGDPNYVKPRNVGVAPCAIDDCGGVVKARGWCSLHLDRWRRLGDPLARLAGEVRGGKRICPRCKLDKPLREWGKAYCLPCGNAISAAHRATNPEPGWRHAAIRRARLLSATTEDFDRIEVFERDGWVCQICRAPVDRARPWRGPRSPTLDHIVPLARGGSHSRTNAQTACFTCNVRKGACLTA